MVVIVLVWALGCVGADGDTGDSSADTPAFTEDLQPIFNRNCVGSCHDATTRSGGLTLAADVAYSELVGVPSEQVPALARVAPGDPDASYLLNKLEGSHMSVGGEGTRMPPELVLAQTELDLFRAWIAAGAAE